ncbi:hypothetical protein C8F04DRAFT_1120965 [Mycena alexandri]|uniref:MYND-type domain-containing protein n=1 Tax=Mycena alexandri TaxID=1745969 RepID=A0AAD6SI43_9AGAR|nr:hypothetical protein C8F04DRAFT_1120965 [Mycena alexandri]
MGEEIQRVASPIHESGYRENQSKNWELQKDVSKKTKEAEISTDSDRDGDSEDDEKDRKYPPIHYSKMCGGCYRTQKQLPSGGILKECKACGTAQYCGRECQKKDWKSHRSQCETNSIAKQQLGQVDYPKMYDDIIKFSDIFKCELADAASYCLKLQLPMNRGAWQTHFFEVRLQYLPWKEKCANRFNIRDYTSRKISDVREPGLERMLNAPEFDDFDDSCGIIIRVVLRGEPPDAKQKSICYMREYFVDPDLGKWSPNWERNFIGSIELVQAGAPKLRTTPDKLDPRFKKGRKYSAKD